MTEQRLFNEAVMYATMKHAGQTRKDGAAYIKIHYRPLKVAYYHLESMLYFYALPKR